LGGYFIFKNNLPIDGLVFFEKFSEPKGQAGGFSRKTRQRTGSFAEGYFTYSIF
jgi:hypothetical protein